MRSFLSFTSRIPLACVLVLAFVSVVVAKGSFTVKPAPAWVRKITPSFDPVSSVIGSGSSSSRLLNDEQIKVSGKSVERYYHYYQRVDNTAGLDDLSQLRFYFEPSYQQLAIHFVRILRKESVIESLRPSEVKIIQEEDELDQQLYNGTQAAVIFLDDIRVGDVIEYAYTILGENPVLGGRFTDTVYLSDNEPIQELSFRLVYPSNRPLAIKNDYTDLQPTTQIADEDTEYLWSASNIRPVILDDSTPSWFNPYPRVNLSEFQSWGEVVQWALPMYQNSNLNNPELREKVEDWKNSSDSPERRAIAALRFVQDEIRYLGIELGSYSHQPTIPEKVFARRFGDCKDKSLLLSSILNAMGIEAAPALVNSRERATLDSWQPTPLAFDHVIVRARINGNTYWFDPTISYQRGGLNSYYDPPFERALVLLAGTTQLDHIPKPQNNSGSIEVVEIYDGETSRPQISLSVTITYRGREADEMRYSLSSTSLANLSRSHLNLYADSTPNISASQLPSVDDNQETNTLVINEKYLISQLWNDNRHPFVADRIYSELHKPRVSQRTSPLQVTYPLSLKQTILIRLGGAYDFPVVSDVLTDDALRFEYSYSKSGNQLSMYFSLQTFADSVPVAAVPLHLEILDKAQYVVGFELSGNRGMQSSSSNEPPSLLMQGIVWMVILIPLGLFVLWLVRRRTGRARLTQFKKDIQARPGASPETALRVGSEDEIELALVNFNCRCGSRPYDPGSPAKCERFSYDGRRLLGIRILCPGCRQSSDLYLDPLFENESGPIADLSAS